MSFAAKVDALRSYMGVPSNEAPPRLRRRELEPGCGDPQSAVAVSRERPETH